MRNKMIRIAALALAGCLLLTQAAQAQDEEEKAGFGKDRLFSGGSISLGFSNNTFQMGANPMLGYNIADWIDAGIVVNYIYTSYRDVYEFNDRLRQSMYGGGAFTRLYPIRFLFAQAQVEHNFIKQKYIPNGGGSSTSDTKGANSLLLGAGYSTNRYPGSGQPFFYLAVLFDVLNEQYSPYTDAYGRSIPIIRAGVQVPLFQGRR